VFVSALFLSVGCQPEAQVETYTVARSAPPRPLLDAAAVLEQWDHILVAIVPQQDKAWFFKLVGKASAIERQRSAFNDFLSTVKLADTSSDTPSWELPEGWEEKEASSMRAATLVIPDSSGELEVAVSSLPLSESWEDFLVPNVIRWLNQLQRGPLAKEIILELAQSVPMQSGKATVFDLAGVMSQQPMGPPFHAGTGPHAGLGIAPPPKPMSKSLSKPEPTAKPLTYETPDGWLPGKQSSMRKATFLLPNGGPTDEVAVTSFGAVAQMADVAANVGRWAGQVKMSPPSDDELKELTEPITISGLEGTYVELTSPPEADVQRAIYAAMLEREGQVWFFKMVGKPDVVSSQRAAFREFLASVRFP